VDRSRHGIVANHFQGYNVPYGVIAYFGVYGVVIECSSRGNYMSFLNVLKGLLLLSAVFFCRLQ
jgi:hypothetical protein